MMNLEQIIKTENENNRSIHLHLEEGVWHAYEYSAFVVSRHMRTDRLERQQANGLVVATVSFDKILKRFEQQITLAGDKYLRIETKGGLTRKDFVLWKQQLP